MRAFVDTNWLLAAHFPSSAPRHAAIVERFVTRSDTPWMVSRVVLAECKNIICAATREQQPSQWTEISVQIGDAIFLTTDSWDTIASKADELFLTYSHKARFGTLDVMILASALLADATHFLSFDSNSNLRALASVLKLKVFPELTADDRRRAAALR